MTALPLDEIACSDALTYLAGLPSASVDMCLVDLPYGSTELAWDSVIPLDPLWEQFKRVSKPRSAIVLTASQPFTSTLVMSNLPMFKYCWVWQKTNIGGYMNAAYMPMQQHEDICVFSASRIRANQFVSDTMNYFPIGLQDAHKRESNKLLRKTAFNHNRTKRTNKSHVTTQTGFPKSILRFNSDRGLHPTQKPVSLFSYLIRTYTQANDVVLDCCMGSGTTAVAARQCGRHFVGCDSSPEYVRLAQQRLAQPWQPVMAGFA